MGRSTMRRRPRFLDPPSLATRSIACGELRETGFALALGNAVIAGWAQLAREDQERLFELAVSAGRVGGRNEVLREDLAKFLHDHHERTAPPRP